MNDAESHPDIEDDEGAAELVDRLRAALNPPPFSEAADRSFLAELPRLAAKQRRRPMRHPALWSGLAAAAAVALAVVLWPNPASGPHADATTLAEVEGAPQPAALPNDINGDGAVDILDAYTLALELQATDPADHPAATRAGRDVTGDGTVDQADVDRLAQLAVEGQTS